MKELLVSNIDRMVSVSQGNLCQFYFHMVRTGKIILQISFLHSRSWKEQEVSSNKFNFTYSKEENCYEFGFIK